MPGHTTDHMALRIRPLLFWLHLATGLVAGLVVLVMSVTGALLAFEKQMTWRADTAHLQVAGGPGAARLPIDTLLARVRDTGLVSEPSAVAVRRDPAAPVALTVAGNRVVYADPYTGRLLGSGNAEVRAFFRGVTDWHRWLAMPADRRATGRAVTGAANLAFLFIVLSGACLWIPRTWAWRQVRQILWFRRGLPGKARDFNWHNTIGVWSVIPLAVVVASGVVISYPWASNLVYRMAGEAPPAPRAEGRAPRPDGAAGGARGGGAVGERRPGPSPALPVLDDAWRAAEAHRPDWRAITLRMPASAAAPLAFTIDEGGPGQPQYRGTLTVDRASGAATWEGFEGLSRGRRLRTVLRFAHTGEVLGLPGQAIAGLVSLGGAVLVYTGVALSLRRFMAWRGRRRRDASAAVRPAA
jgi:uncharacterized iron-regulated membrane protein